MYVRVCMRVQPHLASIATIFPLLFFFVHDIERKVRLRIQHTVAIDGVASRFVTLGKLKFPTLFLSLPRHSRISVSPPLPPASFPTPPFASSAFVSEDISESLGQIDIRALKLIEYRF